MRDLVIVGCGGSGREAAGIVAAINAVSPTWNLLGFVDDAPSSANLSRLSRLGLPLLGGTSVLLDRPDFAIGIGDGAVRARLADLLEGRGWTPASLIHPSATVGSDTRIGPGAVIWPGARLTTNVTLGRHVHVNQNSTIGHDCVLEDFVTLHPLVSISGDCTLRTRSTFGTNCAVLPGRTVGADAMVGASACVVHDVAAGATVKGVPAR